MSYLDDISKAIRYIEDNLESDLTVESIALKVNISPYYFQKSFSLLCGYSISEYIRNRRLTLVGKDLQNSNVKVIDVVMKYRYESPDSFTKAFTRFHGTSPSVIKSGQGELKFFSPLRFEVNLKGGFDMNCKIIKKDNLKLVGYSTLIDYDDGYKACPNFWNKHFELQRNKYVSGQYAICDDSKEVNGKFKYSIADEYKEGKSYPSDAEIITIPSYTWAVFECIGPMPKALQDVNTKVFKEWLPNNEQYKIAGNLNIEYYDDARKYANGTNDNSYHSEIWIPVESK